MSAFACPTAASTLLALLLALLLPDEAAGLEHGWGCIACSTNSMLAANFGTWRQDITLEDPWWVDTIADSYAVVMLNNFWKQGPGSYNGTGTDSKVGRRVGSLQGNTGLPIAHCSTFPAFPMYKGVQC